MRVSSFDTGFGGKGANQAVACARLSHNSDGTTPSGSDVKVSMVGAVGEDSFGSDFLTALNDDHIDITHIERVAGGKTGTANIIVEENSGENRILFFPGANYASGETVKDLVPNDADVVVFQLEIPLVQVASISLARLLDANFLRSSTTSSSRAKRANT
jgi:ribokinase